MTTKKRKAEILELYKSMPDAEKAQFNNIRTARHAKRMYVSIGASLSLVITIIVLIVMIISKSPLTFIPVLTIVFIELWVIYSFEIINLDAQKSWVATLNLPKYYDIVKIIRDIPSDDVKTKKEGRP